MSSSKTSLDALRIERRPEPPSQPRPWLGAIAIGFLLLVSGAFIGWHRRADAVEVQTVTARDANNDGAERTVLNASGYVTARRAATVSSKVTGKVTEVLIEEG
ncbi:MAG TPA: hypothetical protein VL970_03375, partial [Candidatus Acidoferrales bacterium]|nr:hypothetical protein [Candidatus Acidoferrales bacterium]